MISGGLPTLKNTVCLLKRRLVFSQQITKKLGWIIISFFTEEVNESLMWSPGEQAWTVLSWRRVFQNTPSVIQVYLFKSATVATLTFLTIVFNVNYSTAIKTYTYSKISLTRCREHSNLNVRNDCSWSVGFKPSTSHSLKSRRQHDGHFVLSPPPLWTIPLSAMSAAKPEPPQHSLTHSGDQTCREVQQVYSLWRVQMYSRFTVRASASSRKHPDTLPLIEGPLL